MAQYSPEGIENKWYKAWEKDGLFAPDETLEADPFVITLPPPNVTGILHMGHCLGNSIQDVLIRWARMRGRPALWVPGMDHASIATEQVVSKQLAADGINKHDLGRDGFLEKAWDWKNHTHDRIAQQIRRLGCSLDWEREAFTMDDERNEAVKNAFIALKKKDLIYRDVYLVNWCPHDQTAISDDEVEHKEKEGSLWHLRYPFAEGEGHVTVATTRPETMFGDVAVAVHPEDPERMHLIGKEVRLPLTERTIPIIGDHHADPEKGTGFVKITPAHDPNDFEVGRRNDLPQVICMTPTAEMNSEAGQFEGMDRYECRKATVKAMDELGLLDKIEKNIHQVGHHDRCGHVIEPYLSKQWFLRMDDLAEPARAAVKDGEITLFPERWVGVYNNWMSNIRDWCISRQLWWGHRIPVYYCDECGFEMASGEAPAACSQCNCANLTQDEDVLDTWFSSWLWTFSPLGWPQNDEELKKYHPTSLLVRAADIIFFWVARMVMASYEFMDEKPFSEVLFTGIVRDEKGQKMSKSLGNSPDPIDLIDTYGADALRCSLVMLTPTGQDIFFTESTLEVGRNFCNKIFQATKLVLTAWDEAGLPAEAWSDAVPPRTLNFSDMGDAYDYDDEPGRLVADMWAGVFGGDLAVSISNEDLTLEDRWVLSRLLQTVAEANDNMDKRRLNDSAYSVFNFFRHEFCDWYLEATKPRMRDSDNQGVSLSIAVLVLGVSYKLLHPLMPFITEELWSWLPASKGYLMTSSYPVLEDEAPFKKSFEDFEEVKELVNVVRNVRNELGVPPGKRGLAILRVPQESEIAPMQNVSSLVALLAKMETVDVICGGEDPSPAGVGVCGTVEIFLPMKGLVDLEKEKARLEKELGKLEGWMKGCRAKLGNKKFTDNAPDHVVQQQKDLLAENENKATTLADRIKALGS
ncbi:MAG: valine--tRNA ligase [bacterium]|nr:valine--tRNA ligase [bacterium]